MQFESSGHIRRIASESIVKSNKFLSLERDIDALFQFILNFNYFCRIFRKQPVVMYQQDSEVEKREIIKRYRNLLRLWKPRNPVDKKIVRKAFKMALEAHKDMRRKTGEHIYIIH